MCLPTRQNGVENRDKAYWGFVRLQDQHSFLQVWMLFALQKEWTLWNGFVKKIRMLNL